MKKLKVSDLKEGMVFDAPVFVDGESIFIAAGVPVKASELGRLAKWGVTEVETDGKLVDPAAAQKAGPRAEKRRWVPGADKKQVQAYMDAVEGLGGILDDLGAQAPVPRDRIDGIAQKLIERVKDARNEMVQVVVFADQPRKRIAASSVNSAVLAAVIGMQLKLTAHHLLQLTVGALLHDVGMLAVPSRITEKQDKLTAEEIDEIRKHPQHSYRVIDKVLRYPQEVAEVALYHHERWDGKGYPRHLRGEDIPVNARILAVAESYAAMVKDRPHRSSMIGYTAMKNILSDNGRQFDPRILKAFLSSTGVFPIGSIVQLNNSSIGRVVSINGDAPLRPRLELVVDEAGRTMAEQIVVDLMERKHLFIVKAIDPRTLEASSGSPA
jgi:HD-GYP domain-containing protein (c-di-GMP phosphodiesterase class II)